MNTFKKIPLLLCLLVFGVQIAQAGHEDGVGDVLTGVAITGAVAAGVIGITALGKRMFGPSSETMLTKAEDCYREVHDRYGKLIYVVERAHNAPITALSYQEKQDMLHNPCEHLLSELRSCLNSDAHTYRVRMATTIDELKRNQKKVARFMKKRSSAKYVDLPYFAEDLTCLIEKLTVMERVVARHQAYFELAATQHALLQKYGADLVVAEKHKDSAGEFSHKLRSSIMEQGRLANSTFPYLAYVDTISQDKRALENKLSKISAHTYEDKCAESKALYTKLDAIAREVMADDEYAQSLKDKEKLRLQQSLEREQARLANENNRLRSELAREQRRPHHVVVEHEYVSPWCPLIAPVYTVDYVEPIIVQPDIAFECYDDYCYDDPTISLSMGFNL